MINVPDARLAITSWGPERPSSTPRRVRRENLIGVSSGSPVVEATADHSFVAVSTRVESATGGGTLVGAADSCACACPVAWEATKLPSRGPAAAASFATTTPAATAPPAAAPPPDAPPAPAPPPPAPLDGPPGDGPAAAGEL